MLTDYYAHTYYDDPKAAESTIEDDDFDIDDVASIIGANNPDDWEELS